VSIAGDDWAAVSTVSEDRMLLGCHLRIWHWPLGIWPDKWSWRVYVPCGKGAFVSGETMVGEADSKNAARAAAEERAKAWARP
jgi:hypothetical protein